MDLISSLRSLRRHWILTSIFIVFTLAATAAATLVLPWTYQAQSTVVLLASQQGSKLNGDNPYLSFDGALTNTAYVVSVIVTGPGDQARFASQGDTGEYTVALSTATDGPVLLVNVTAHSKAVAQDTMKAVTGSIQDTLSSIQAKQNITAPNQIRSQVAAMSPQATVLFSKKAKDIGLALALGLFLTFGVPILTDAHQARRKEERGPAAADEPQREKAASTVAATAAVSEPVRPVYPAPSWSPTDEVTQQLRAVGWRSAKPAAPPSAASSPEQPATPAEPAGQDDAPKPADQNTPSRDKSALAGSWRPGQWGR